MSSNSELVVTLFRLSEIHGDELTRGRMIIDHFHPVPFGSPFVWSADPFGHPQWRHRLHSLYFLWPLLRDGVLDEAGDIAEDWIENNPREHPASDYSWAHHTTANRALALA